MPFSFLERGNLQKGKVITMTKEQELLRQKMMEKGLFPRVEEIPVVLTQNISQEDMFSYMAQLFKKQREDISRVQKDIEILGQRVTVLETNTVKSTNNMSVEEIVNFLSENGYPMTRRKLYEYIAKNNMAYMYKSAGYRPCEFYAKKGYLVESRKYCGKDGRSFYYHLEFTPAGKSLLLRLLQEEKIS